MSDKVYKVLFLCTGNSARSIMAEALMTTMSNGRFQAYSAGSTPTGKVHPMALEMVKITGYPLDKLRSKSWDEFALPDAPQMDFVITMCDDAADEVCPYWPGQPMSAHWGVENPATATGSEEYKRKVFHVAFYQIRARIALFLSLPLDTLEHHAILHEIKAIGHTTA
jgi:arsenate reductase